MSFETSHVTHVHELISITGHGWNIWVTGLEAKTEICFQPFVWAVKLEAHAIFSRIWCSATQWVAKLPGLN